MGRSNRMVKKIDNMLQLCLYTNKENINKIAFFPGTNDLVYPNFQYPELSDNVDTIKMRTTYLLQTLSSVLQIIDIDYSEVHKSFVIVNGKEIFTQMNNNICDMKEFFHITDKLIESYGFLLYHTLVEICIRVREFTEIRRIEPGNIKTNLAYRKHILDDIRNIIRGDMPRIITKLDGSEKVNQAFLDLTNLKCRIDSIEWSKVQESTSRVIVREIDKYLK